MTDFEKVKNYYRHFDEKNRLRNDNSGKLEFLMTMRILEKKLPPVQMTESADGVSILDLGGGAGVYSFPLAKKGYKIVLADLSETLLAQAAKQKKEDDVQNLISCDQVNATDLSCYKDQSFDVVLLFGPLYHLTEKAEREKCISEVSRVLKRGGKIFASRMPWSEILQEDMIRFIRSYAYCFLLMRDATEFFLTANHVVECCVCLVDLNFFSTQNRLLIGIPDKCKDHLTISHGCILVDHGRFG